MRSSLLIVLTAALAGVNAQLSAIPSCALNCLLTGIISTGCATTDFACSCSNTDFIASASACIKVACSAEDYQKAKEATRVLCRDEGGIDIVFPDDRVARKVGM
ncbi:hypothetical protein EX30DRAFT_341979 [Ascodesmis nigricans]|uniref:CFEM domain-containing protein n=1 Tax=Ascodesmis nigricans TaxID=341454 RepID=A0A4S2MTR2_9PEZI|nr:hypothetical protein EX30DRAFT_341979 [Ascodesmis nigricans]